MGDILCEDYEKAKASRERQAQDAASKPYYWWEYPDPFETEATPTSTNNNGGLARSRSELKRRQSNES